jgi:hypothetical protein
MPSVNEENVSESQADGVLPIKAGSNGVDVLLPDLLID